jgi:hypothetical protein
MDGGGRTASGTSGRERRLEQSSRAMPEAVAERASVTEAKSQETRPRGRRDTAGEAYSESSNTDGFRTGIPELPT